MGADQCVFKDQTTVISCNWVIKPENDNMNQRLLTCDLTSAHNQENIPVMWETLLLITGKKGIVSMCVCITDYG